MALSIGDQAPDFTLPDENGNLVSLSSFRGGKTVLYFYPKDDTPGCTTEACDFRDAQSGIRALSAQVIGVSKDSAASHKKFKMKYGLNFPLLSDESQNVCEKYGVWVEKSMYGRNYMGIERATFLIGADGRIENIWRKVSVPNHVAEIIAALGGKTPQAANSNKKAKAPAMKKKPAAKTKAKTKIKSKTKPKAKTKAKTKSKKPVRNIARKKAVKHPAARKGRKKSR